jgi:hypothetical protein
VYVNADNAVTECPAPTGPGCGNNWADIKAGGGNCQSVGAYSPLQVTAQYVATCAAGSHPQWGFLTYSTSVASNASGNSDITFAAQTAPVNLNGTMGSFTSYATVADAVATDPAVCQAPCQTDMYAKLGGTPAATNAVLNLQITISPTPDGQASGTLQSYQITYDCVPSQ